MKSPIQKVFNLFGDGSYCRVASGERTPRWSGLKEERQTSVRGASNEKIDGTNRDASVQKSVERLVGVGETLEERVKNGVVNRMKEKKGRVKDLLFGQPRAEGC